MATPFDAYSSNVFKTATAIMGRSASWTPSSGGAAVTAMVLFSAPARESSGDESGPAPIWPTMEYFPADLTGLLEAVREGKTEVVVIDGTSYTVAAVDPIRDGSTYLAHFEAQ